MKQTFYKSFVVCAGMIVVLFLFLKITRGSTFFPVLLIRCCSPFSPTPFCMILIDTYNLVEQIHWNFIGVYRTDGHSILCMKSAISESL